MVNDSIKGDVKETLGKVQTKVGEVTGDQDMEARGAARDLAGQAQSLYGDLKDGASNVAGELSDMAAKRFGPDNAKALQNAVHQNPLVALALAAAAGFLLSTLTSR